MKKGLLFCYLILVSLGLKAQAPDFAWARKAGGSDSDVGSGIVVDGSGNSYVIGGFIGTTIFGNFTLTSSGLSDVFIAKYDPAGTVLWAMKAGGTDDEYGASIAVDGSGNCYVTGQFGGSATFGNTTVVSSGSEDVFIAKYDATGAVLWVKQAGGTSSDEGYDIAVDNSGNSYVTGYFSGSATFGSTILTGSGSADIFIAKYNAVGTMLWASQAGGTSGDYGQGIAVDGSGNSYVTGHFFGSVTLGSVTLASIGSADIFVAKYDGSGTVLWAKQSGGTTPDVSDGIAVDGNSNSYITGYFRGSATFGNTTLSSSGDADIFIAKYDASGTVLWAKRAGGTIGDDIGKDISIDSSGNSYVTGYFSGSATLGSVTLVSSGSYDIFIAKYGASGTLHWAQQAGGTSDDYSNSIDVDDSGNSYLSGYFNGSGTSSGSATFGSTTLVSSGSVDIFIAKLNASSNLINTAFLQTNYCPGVSFNIPFTATGTFTPGNLFTAQLSNASGSFASPVSIGSLTDTTSGTISATIPAGTQAGSGYRIRVVASNPSVIGINNGTDLTISAPPIVTTAASSSTICQGVSTTLTASGAVTYLWSNGQTGDSITVSPGATTTYTVTGTSAQGCSVTDSVTVAVAAAPVLPFVSVTANCEGESILFATLPDSSIASYNWSGPGGFISTLLTAEIPNATPAHSGTYSLTVTNAAGCNAQSSFPVTVRPLPDSTFTVSGSGNTYTFTANGTGSYDWTFAGGTPATSTAQSVTVTFSGQGSFPVSLFTTGPNQCGAGSTQLISILGSEEPLSSKASLYPNPTNGLLKVELPAPLAEPAVLQVYNALGQEVRVASMSQGTIEKVLDLTGLPAGHYQLRLQAPGWLQNRAFVLQR
jgi:hypothetical protein